MRSLLITGGAGFIGSNFIAYWRDQYPEDRLVVLDALTYAGNRANLPEERDAPGFRFVQGDIRDYDQIVSLLREYHVDTLLHFAAESHVDRSIHEPDAFITTNIVGTHNLLRAAREVWLNADDAPAEHRFHHVSTDEVYGSLKMDDAAFREDTPYAPNSPYAASKAASDHLVRAYTQTYGLQTSTSNCSNNYGPFQFPEKLIPLMILNALHGKQLPVYGDGSNRRDWLYVEDHCRGIEAVLLKGKVGETYNIGGGHECANLDIVKLICTTLDQMFATDPELAKLYKKAPAASGKPTESLIEFVTDRPGHDWRYAIDDTKAVNELGYTASVSFSSGLHKTIEWMLANTVWWTSVMDGSYRQWIDQHYGD